MSKAYCPDCDAVITVDNPRTGEFIRCGQCGYELEIISTHPFEVDYPLDYDSGWDDEEEEEDEEEYEYAQEDDEG
jgi:lysine biosynthesis protein LysW